MEAFVDKMDFYRGKYSSYRLKSLCALRGENESFVDVMTILLEEESNSTSAFCISLLLPIKEMFPYISQVCLSFNETPLQIIEALYRERGTTLSAINLRLLQDLPNTKSDIESITRRMLNTNPTVDSALVTYLNQTHLPKEDTEILSQIAFYNDRSLLAKIICKRKGWPNASLNKLSFLLSHV